MSTNATTGLLHAYLLDGKGGAKTLDWAAIAGWRADDGVLWLNVDYSAPDVVEWLEHQSGIDLLIREALLDADPRPRAVAHGDALMLIVRGINMNEGSTPEDMLSIRSLVEPCRILTMHHRVSRTLKAFVADIEHRRGPTNAGEFTAQLVESIVEHVVSRVDLLGDEIAACEDEILTDTRSDLRARLADQRRRAIALRRFLAPQREALGKLGSIDLSWMRNYRGHIAETADRMTRTIEELDAARDRAAVTQEELASRLAEMTSSRLYVLSIVTSVFLPLGFVCALLGVNVGGVPLQHAEWAFWALCGTFLVGVGALMLWFKHRGWL